MKPFEIIEVVDRQVACDGAARPSDHPRVFLHLDKKTHRIQCPYCSRVYVLKGSDQLKAG
jgi:uncharacterized Zn-finger protein